MAFTYVAMQKFAVSATIAYCSKFTSFKTDQCALWEQEVGTSHVGVYFIITLNGFLITTIWLHLYITTVCT